jgi:hypothetical protein
MSQDEHKQTTARRQKQPKVRCQPLTTSSTRHVILARTNDTNEPIHDDQVSSDDESHRPRRTGGNGVDDADQDEDECTNGLSSRFSLMMRKRLTEMERKENAAISHFMELINAPTAVDRERSLQHDDDRAAMALSKEPIRQFEFVDFSLPDVDHEQAYSKLVTMLEYERWLKQLDAAAYVEHLDAWLTYVSEQVDQKADEHSTLASTVAVVHRLFPASNRINISLIDGLTRVYYQYSAALKSQSFGYKTLKPAKETSETVIKLAKLLNVITHACSMRRLAYEMSISSHPAFSLHTVPLTNVMLTMSDLPDGDFDKFVISFTQYCARKRYAHKGEYVYRRKTITIYEGVCTATKRRRVLQTWEVCDPDVNDKFSAITKRQQLLPYYEQFKRILEVLSNYNRYVDYDPEKMPVDYITVPSSELDFAAHHAKFKRFADDLVHRDSPYFPILKVSRNMLCFRDSVYDTERDLLLSHNDISAQVFCFNFIDVAMLHESLQFSATVSPASNLLDAGAVPTFYPYDLDPRENDEEELELAAERQRDQIKVAYPAASERIVRVIQRQLDPFNISTPDFDCLLNHQWVDADNPEEAEQREAAPAVCIVQDRDIVKRFFYAFIGQLFFPIDANGSTHWEMIPTIVGFPQTGKSKLADQIQRMLGVHNVGQLGSDVEKNFPLSHAWDKMLWMTTECEKTYHNISTETFLKIVSGERVTVKIKNRDQFDHTWSSRGILFGNNFPYWAFNGTLGNTLRRLAVMFFYNPVNSTMRDDGLPYRLCQQTGLFAIKCIRHFHALRSYNIRSGIKNVQNMLPAYMKMCATRMKVEVNALEAFLSSGAVIYNPGYICSVELLRACFVQYCSDNAAQKSTVQRTAGTGWLECAFSEHGLKYYSKVCADRDKAKDAEAGPVLTGGSRVYWDASGQEPVHQRKRRKANGGQGGGRRPRGGDREKKGEDIDNAANDAGDEGEDAESRYCWGTYPNYLLNPPGRRVCAVFIAGIDIHPHHFSVGLRHKAQVEVNYFNQATSTTVNPLYERYMRDVITQNEQATGAAEAAPIV